MVSIPLAEKERAAIVASPGYLASRGTPKEIGDLAQHDCIRFRMPATGRIYRWELLRASKEIELEVDGPVTVNDSSAMMEAAAEGLGLAYTLESTAKPYLASGRLVRLLEKASPAFPGFHLYYPSRRQLPAKLRCFIDFLRAQDAGR